MTDPAPGGAETAERTAPDWRVREATLADAAGAAAAIGELLVELGGEGPSTNALEEATRKLIDDPEAGVLLIAEVEGDERPVGVLAASWQFAVHVPGRYGTIQDLWVNPEWRSRAIGRDLMEAFFDIARRQGARRVEVGLPRDDFPNLRATEAFYVASGFVPLGPRMRRVL
ncbi:MAG: GNAT family N-acetyltransferase [Chloroflexota bacterium]